MDKVKAQHEFMDSNARRVHAFSLEMANLGFSRMGELLVAMLEDGAWRKFKTGLGTHEFLDGEFDYFLSQQGIDREHVMRGVSDVAVKARLESAMDERRTGEDGYRRRLLEVRKAVPEQPGRPILPYGVTQSERKVLVSEAATGTPSQHREALGAVVRRYTLSGGKRTKRPSDSVPQLERVKRSASRLKDSDLAALIEALQAERKKRKRHLRAVLSS